MLKIVCVKHPKYKAIKKPEAECPSCSLLYILRWQHEKTPDQHLGSLNPYQFIGDLEVACDSLRAMKARGSHPQEGRHILNMPRDKKKRRRLEIHLTS